MSDTPRSFRLIGDCASIGMEHVDELMAMTDRARTITRRTFCRWSDAHDRRDWERCRGYSLTSDGGLTAAKDWAIAYYRSTWYGRPCVYIVWSAYEVIFVGEA